MIAVGARLDGAQALDFGEGEVAGEECGGLDAVEEFGGLFGCELGAGLDVGGVVKDGFVAGNEMAVLSGDEIGLDVVGAEFDGAAVAFEGVLGEVTAGAAVSEDERLLAIEGAPTRRPLLRQHPALP